MYYQKVQPAQGKQDSEFVRNLKKMEKNVVEKKASSMVSGQKHKQKMEVGTSIQRKQQGQTYQDNSKERIQCHKCNILIDQKNLFQHLSKCQGGQISFQQNAYVDTLQCSQCSNFIDIFYIDEHQKACLGKQTACRYCHCIYPKKLIEDHLSVCQKYFRKHFHKEQASLYQGYKKESKELQKEFTCVHCKQKFPSQFMHQHGRLCEAIGATQSKKKRDVLKKNVHESKLKLRSLEKKQHNKYHFKESSKKEQRRNQKAEIQRIFNEQVRILQETDDLQLLNALNLNGQSKKKEKRSLKPSEIEQIPLVEFKKNEKDEEVQCEICMIELETGELVMNLRCLHKFHIDCLAPWLQSKSACPKCRTSIVE